MRAQKLFPIPVEAYYPNFQNKTRNYRILASNIPGTKRIGKAKQEQENTIQNSTGRTVRKKTEREKGVREEEKQTVRQEKRTNEAGKERGKNSLLYGTTGIPFSFSVSIFLKKFFILLR